MSSTVNERFKEVRKLLKLNQEKFAKEIGVSRAHVSNIENGNDNPSSALIKLICMKYNIDEKWLADGVGSPDLGWDMSTDEGAIAKYNAMRVSFEQKLHRRSGNDLINTIESFSYLNSLLSPKNLNNDEKSKYLESVRAVIDEWEKFVFMVSNDTLFPPKNDAQSWLTFRNECDAKVKIITNNIKDSVNIYLNSCRVEMKL